MDHALQPMSPAEYSAVQRELGAKVVSQNGIFWRRVRPFFYRPILPFQEISRAEMLTSFHWPCGFQHVLAGGEPANSMMHFIMLDQLQAYALGDLGRRRQQLIRQAARQFEVRPVRDLREFKEQGFRVYQSFYDRTGYGYRKDRKSQAGFHQWAETIFRQPKVILLGGYGAAGLVGLSCSFWVDRTLVYASLFCETEALKKNLGELMFHQLRMLAAQEPRIAEILVRNYQMGNSLDHYYLLRGAKLVSKPARLVMPALIRTGIKWFLRRQHALLTGQITAPAAPAAPA
jgi:hypothetical protein